MFMPSAKFTFRLRSYNFKKGPQRLKCHLTVAFTTSVVKLTTLSYFIHTPKQYQPLLLLLLLFFFGFFRDYNSAISLLCMLKRKRLNVKKLACKTFKQFCETQGLVTRLTHLHVPWSGNEVAEKPQDTVNGSV